MSSVTNTISNVVFLVKIMPFQKPILFHCPVTSNSPIFFVFVCVCVCVCVSVQVVDQSGLVDEAACVLSSLRPRLNEGSRSSDDCNRVHLRIKALQNTLVHSV